jgi:hypothetical protein
MQSRTLAQCLELVQRKDIKRTIHDSGTAEKVE